jgi:hypothetical protein
MMASTPLNIAIARRLVDLFGGKLIYSDREGQRKTRLRIRQHSYNPIASEKIQPGTLLRIH